MPPNILGWEVGTFEFTSPRILALNYGHHAAIKLRTGGSVGRVGRSHCHRLNEGDGFYWELNSGAKNSKVDVRLPVKYRFRSPVIFEFHLPNKRKADAYALVWLQHLIDNEDTPINAPIWRTKNPARLVQNYVTEENVQAKSSPGLEDLQLIGRLQFRGRFKAGMDESHGSFVVDNDTRETFETWEACLGEGVRSRVVEKQVPELTQELHEKSLDEGREMLKAADPNEQRRWVSKQGTDWSGAFGHNPKAYMDTSGRKRREPGQEAPGRDPFNPNDDNNEDYDNEGYSDDDDSNDDGATDDLGIQNSSNMSPSQRTRKSTETGGTGATGFNSEVTQDTDSQSPAGGGGGGEPKKSRSGLAKVFTGESTDSKGQNKRAEERKQRGLMQWKPARNAKFAKDEGVLGLKKLKGKVTGGLEGRQPEPETEV